MFEFEKQLDDLLAFFANRGTNNVTPIQNTPKEFHNNIQKLINTLIHHGYIEYVKVHFNNNNQPTEFHNIFSITPTGIAFCYSTNSFVRQAKYKEKNHKNFNFNSFKMRYETVISTIAIILSIIALVISIAF